MLWKQTPLISTACSELAERITKLSAFILQNNLFKGFEKEKRDLMEGQLQAMNLYSYFLDKRIAMEEKAH